MIHKFDYLYYSSKTECIGDNCVQYWIIKTWTQLLLCHTIYIFLLTFIYFFQPVFIYTHTIWFCIIIKIFSTLQMKWIEIEQKYTRVAICVPISYHLPFYSSIRKTCIIFNYLYSFPFVFLPHMFIKCTWYIHVLTVKKSIHKEYLLFLCFIYKGIYILSSLNTIFFIFILYAFFMPVPYMSNKQ